MNTLPKQPITCRKCGFECAVCKFAEVDWSTRRGLCNKCVASPVLHCYHSSVGIGDAIVAAYAACGAAAAGHQTVLHSTQSHWLSRASYPGLQIAAQQNPRGTDLYAGYGASLKAGTCRKQWYCDNLSRSVGIEPFAPAAPIIDSTIREKRIPIENYVVLCPTSAWRVREWPEIHWTRLAILLREQGVNVVGIGGHRDGERLANIFGATGATWYWGASPEWVFDVLLGSRGFVGNDSGMAHLAAMLNVETVAVHAQVSAEQLWGGTGVLSVMPDTQCAGCNWQRERGWREPCANLCSALQTISPETVLETIKGVL